MENEQLKIEEIVGYLPYRLKVLRPDNKTIMSVSGIVGNLYIFQEIGKFETYGSIKSNANKLILHPLEDLKKEQLSNFSVNFRMWYNKKNFNYNLMIYSDIELCHKLHIDYRNLIKRKLAININTLNND